MPTTLDHDTPTGRSPGGRGRALGLGAVGVVVLLAIGIAIGNHLHHNTSKTPAAGKATVTTGAPTPSSSASPAPGLVRGPAAVGAGGTSAVYGVPIGYQHTETGAIDAATNYTVGLASPTRFNAAGRQALFAAILQNPADPTFVGTAAQTAQLDAKFGINDSGQVIDSTGAVHQQLKFFANAYPQWGAYQILSSSADRLEAEIWAPWVVGPASDDDKRRLTVAWSETIATVVWKDDDWKLADSPTPPATTPKPADLSTPSVSFAERAELLPGWTLYSDATEQAWQYPGQVLS